MLWRWRTCLMTVASLSMLAVAACGGGGGSDDTAREISNEELAQMVLSLDQFGPEFSGFTPDTDNGFQTVEQVAEGEDDPAAEQADLEQFGWAATYEVEYVNPAGIEVVGVMGGGSTVYLFATAEGADGYWQDSVAEVENPERGGGSTALQNAERIDFEVGDESIGFVLRVQAPKDDGSTGNYTGWLMYFTHGRLLGSLYVSAADIDDVEGERLQSRAETLASVLNDRIAARLAAQAPSAAPAAAGP